jgi:hypothetical protein
MASAARFPVPLSEQTQRSQSVWATIIDVGLFSSLGSNACFRDSCSEKLGVLGVLAVQNLKHAVDSVPALKNLAFLAFWRFKILNTLWTLCLL